MTDSAKCTLYVRACSSIHISFFTAVFMENGGSPLDLASLGLHAGKISFEFKSTVVEIDVLKDKTY